MPWMPIPTRIRQESGSITLGTIQDRQTRRRHLVSYCTHMYWYNLFDFEVSSERLCGVETVAGTVPGTVPEIELRSRSCHLNNFVICTKFYEISFMEKNNKNDYMRGTGTSQGRTFLRGSA
jgi:hypothetical protein